MSIYYVTVITLVAGMILATTKLTKENSASFGIQVVYIMKLTNSLQYLLRQVIQVSCLMISAERAFKVTELPVEKLLYTLYDEKNSITLPLSA